jgi:lysophospholipase L1-like esterase
MRAMIREAQTGGARVVVITAPSNHERGHEPEYLKARHVRSLDEVVPLHQAYVEATRAMARENGATLCDAAEAFDRSPIKRQLFQRDGIHLTGAGDSAIADLLVPCIVDAVRH